MTLMMLGTRASPLALAQTNRVIQALEESGHAAAAKPFSTKGDRVLDRPLQDLGDKGVFTAELEAALKTGDIVGAVHSAKDMSAIDDPDLPIVAALPRDARHDMLISNLGQSIETLPTGAKIGTSSLRRASQISALRPDLAIKPVRGNIQTRLRKWQDGEVDALILAAAGLARMGLDKQLPAHDLSWPYAPSQGIIAVQAREPSKTWHQISDATTMTALQIERALIRGLGANCRQPVACHVDMASGEGVANLFAWDKQGHQHQISKTFATGQNDQNLIEEAEALGQTLRGKLALGLAGE